ncbi:TonB-dependent receptor [Hymenobacter sp. BT683]|uniref:TonB-dependent receptor n=1 Tax=Hymenobacter jeongseonensis TaxID=2791027 RepID=A0ABS0ILS2_9BACT|nr:TonB-dependent receptor [Hymenobacter jeongseonensis]MBF9238730.1 TonB-dependent receptor [Hymenobacter jeongseonensis]
MHSLYFLITTRFRRVGALMGLLLTTLGRPVAFAQPTAILRGTVADSLSGQPLAGVSVGLEGQPGGTATDALGRFRFAGVAAGTYTLRVGALGYRNAAQPVTVAAGETLTRTFRIAPAALSLAEVTVSQPRDPNQSLAAINQIDKVLRPVNSAQDLLRLVPGLFIAQHAGGGKAEQIFLRGFDVDHGTDFAVSVDGLPVNMVSHAHGQGYADFHFVIPETVEQLKVYKGPYTARFGDFATAGAGEFSTKTRLDASQVKLEVGRFDTRRALVMLDLLGNNNRHLFSKKPESAYVAAEYSFTNAYFDQPQDFRRFNGLAKYTGQLSDRTALTLLGSHFTSSWDASGQIPESAVRDGIISRFGSLDPSEGGHTNRTNASVVLTTGLPGDAVIRQQLYYSRYNFNLFSNFTFFLNDEENGDEINQTDARNIYGYTGTYDRDDQLGARSLHTTFGLGTRIDAADVTLRRAVRRTISDTITAGRVFEQNLNAYLDETLALTDRLTLNAAVRADVFTFDFQGIITNDNGNPEPLNGRKTRARVSPKLNVYYELTPTVQLFARSGYGFHSNDARGVVRGTRNDNVLPRALGYEAGSTFKPLPGVVVNAAFWALHLEDELMYVGDEAIVESAGRTRRYGADFSVRYQLTRALFADVDLNYNHGRLVGVAEGQNYIPLAPRFTSVGGLTLKSPQGFGASLRYRHLDRRPANEDNSIQARGYFLLDGVLSYTRSRFQLGATAENLFNVAWNEAQFANPSRLRGQTTPVVEQLHFTPGTPFFIKVNASVFF